MNHDVFPFFVITKIILIMVQCTAEQKMIRTELIMIAHNIDVCEESRKIPYQKETSICKQVYECTSYLSQCQKPSSFIDIHSQRIIHVQLLFIGPFAKKRGSFCTNDMNGRHSSFSVIIAYNFYFDTRGQLLIGTYLNSVSRQGGMLVGKKRGDTF